MLGVPYQRPNKPFRVERGPKPDIGLKPDREAPKPLYVDKFTECHITPREIAARMCAYLGAPDEPPNMALEPQAGTGALLQGLAEHGYNPQYITAIERHNSLAARLDSSQAAHIVNGCFLDFADRPENQGRFTRIISNPPFRAVKAHMKAALKCLARENAVLIALVPANYACHEMEILEHLPDDTFTTAKVRTKIICIERGPKRASF